MAKRRLFLAALLLILSLVCAARAAPVTWTFYQTSCTAAPESLASCGRIGESGPISTPPTPVGTLTLPGPISSGSAIYNHNGTPPVLTGDGNNFSLFFGFPPASMSALVLNPPTELSLDSTFYNVRWDETPDDLTDVLVNYENPFFSGSADVGEFGGEVGSDGEVGSCIMGECMITGFWSTSIPSVPEPSSLKFLVAGLFLLAPLALIHRLRGSRPTVARFR